MELGAHKDCRQEDECGPDWVMMVEVVGEGREWRGLCETEFVGCVTI